MQLMLFSGTCVNALIEIRRLLQKFSKDDFIWVSLFEVVLNQAKYATCVLCRFRGTQKIAESACDVIFAGHSSRVFRYF